MDRICFFTGSKSAFNILFDTLNFGWMLQDDFELDLVTTQPENVEPLQEFFTIHGQSYPETTIGGARALREYLDGTEPDVISNVVEPSVHGNIVAHLASSHDVPCVYRYSGDLFAFYKVSRGWRKPAQFVLNNLFNRVALSSSDAFMALGPNGKNRLLDHGAAAAETVTLPPPIDASRFDDPGEAALDIPNDRKVVLYAGRRSRIKGMHDMNTAIPELVKRRNDLQFVFVGSNGMEPDVPPKYEDHVTMVGRVPLGAMPKYFARADLLVLPSYNEGLPRVITEALCADTPVIARDVADIASATANTFETLDEFLAMVLNFEELSVDDPTRFTREALQEEYIEFFSQF